VLDPRLRGPSREGRGQRVRGLTHDAAVEGEAEGLVGRGGSLAEDDQCDAVAQAEVEVNDTDARLWHPWPRINRVLRVMLHTRWSAEDWPQVKVEFAKALALWSVWSEARRAGWSN